MAEAALCYGSIQLLLKYPDYQTVDKVNAGDSSEQENSDSPSGHHTQVGLLELENEEQGHLNLQLLPKEIRPISGK